MVFYLFFVGGLMTIYMKVNGIDGDVTAKGHENWISLQSIRFNVKRFLSTDPGRISDREGTRPALSEIIINKKMDKSSPLLFGESCVGKAKSQIQIDICQTDSSLNTYAQFTLNNVIISGYDLNADETVDHSHPERRHYPLETVSLSFDKIEVRYIPYNSQNQAQSPIPAGYDLKQATSV